MNDCPSRELLARLADDDLDPEVFAAVEAHVARCPRCQAELETMAWRPPTTLGDDDPAGPRPGPFPRVPGFAIERELGRGAMGVVYLARRDGLDRPVALKVAAVGSGPTADPGARRRWLAEARAASRARHPNVVSLYDYGEADGCLYLVIEYVPGGTLARRMDGPLPPRDAAALVAEVAAGVEHVHARGILHLDLKPSNILLDSPPDAPWRAARPRVADFGLARPGEGPGADASTLTGLRGTPPYMAPEQVRGAPRLGPTADVHALGAILYEAITGRPPFRAASVLETLEQVRDQSPASPRAVNSRVCRDLETVVLKCLEKDPRLRYPSAAALADDLLRWLHGSRSGPARSRPPVGPGGWRGGTPGPRPRSPRRPWPWRSASPGTSPPAARPSATWGWPPPA